MVALEKDPDDKTKPRPLGVPSAIRRISAILVLSEYSSEFAAHLLPYNFAVGVGGGCDVIIKTLQLAVDKYISEKEDNGDLPSRCLVSLDIRNMFNAVSRERLREIISDKFPTLEAFSDLIYEEAGETFVKLEDGDWTIISVEEGFTQGCPVSPVFAAIVLNEILDKIQQELNQRASIRVSNGELGDDGFGTLGIILAYVDDVNSLLSHDDATYFLQRFVELATPLGAILNTEKTRILTSTSGSSIVDKLIGSNKLKHTMRGTSLKQTIEKYSTKIVNGERVPVEVTDGLRVLGAPIGSPTFCKTFINDILKRAINDSNKLLSSLEDVQTMVRLFSVCTVHKTTHLFSSDVFNSPIQDLPNHFYLWDSSFADNFTQMVDSFISQVTHQEKLPPHSLIISNLSINQGGLGIQHPRGNAITSYMMSSKRCLQYTHEGVWLGPNKPRPMLPNSITSLYTNWQ